MPFPITRAMSTEECSCYFQSYLAVEKSGQHDGNLLRVVKSGSQWSLDFKGHSCSSQTSFVFKKLKTPARDFRVCIEWRENCFLAAVGRELVIESTHEPLQPRYQFILSKARPSHAFMFKNAACHAQYPDCAYINSDENGMVFMGPGSVGNPQAWVNVTFAPCAERCSNSVFPFGRADENSMDEGTFNCRTNKNTRNNTNSVIKPWSAFYRKASYV